MKLVKESFLYNIDIEENVIEILVIEDSHQFAEVISELKMQLDEQDRGWILSEAGKQVSFSKYVDIIIDPFMLDLNNRRILSKLYGNIEKEILETELEAEWRRVHSEMLGAVMKFMDDIPYALDCKEDGTVADFLKEMDVKFATNPENLLEKIIDYMCVTHSVMGKKVFIFVNIKSYLTRDEMALLYQKANYEKIFIILIENKDTDDKIEGERVTVIDKDLCGYSKILKIKNHMIYPYHVEIRLLVENPDEDLRFESSVNSYGSQTTFAEQSFNLVFESSVNSYGSQTHLHFLFQ